MPDFGYAFGDQPAMDPRLNDVARTDLLLDALAERTEVDLDDPNDDALAALLGEWRDDLRWPPASALVSQDEAVEALLAGMADRRRARRGLAAIGSVAATLLVLSGFGAVVAEARPGETLYGLHAMFFDQPRVNEDQIMLSAKADLARVQQLIDQGKWDQAQNQLAEVSSMVQSMNDDGRRHNLMDQVNLLNAKVEARDPNATLPAPETKPPTAPVASTTSAAPITTTVAATPTTSPPGSSPAKTASPRASSSAPSPSPSPTPSSTRPRKRNSSPAPTPGSAGPATTQSPVAQQSSPALKTAAGGGQ
jgi:hypothetical protein